MVEARQVTERVARGSERAPLTWKKKRHKAFSTQAEKGKKMKKKWFSGSADKSQKYNFTASRQWIGL